MADPLYYLIALGLVLALAVATMIPPPSRRTEDGEAWGMALIVVGSAAVFSMGILALFAYPVASIALGVTAWLIVMPCVWLARAPESPDDGWYEAQEDGDDDGGSPPPYDPWAPPAPDEAFGAMQAPASEPAVRPRWTPAPQAAPVLATAARVQRLLAAQDDERLRAAQQVERLLALQQAEQLRAAAAQIPLPETPGAAPEAPGPLHSPPWPALQPRPRVRADHRSIAHALAAVAHVCSRRRSGVLPEPERRHAGDAALRD